MSQTVAGIDIHKKVLMVVVATVSESAGDHQREQQIEYQAGASAAAPASGSIWWRGCGSAPSSRW